MSDWISAKDKLPEDEGYALVSVLVSIDDGDSDPLVTVAEYSSIDACFLDQEGLREIGSEGCFQGAEVTHWMPLPSAPSVIVLSEPEYLHKLAVGE